MAGSDKSEWQVERVINLISQKIIDNLIRELNDKADVSQTVFMDEDIKNNSGRLLLQVDYLADIAGPERTFEGQRAIDRDNNCISCRLPPRDFLKIPKLKPLSSIKTTSETIGFDKRSAHGTKAQDHTNICYPNRPIHHPIDPRYNFIYFLK